MQEKHIFIEVEKHNSRQFDKLQRCTRQIRLVLPALSFLIIAICTLYIFS